MAPAAVAIGLTAGVVLDELFGDQVRAHPVATFGNLAAAAERRWYADSVRAGTGFTVAVVAPLVAAAVVVERVAARRPRAHIGLLALCTWTVLGGRGLRRAALAVGDALACDDLVAARTLLPTLCGRDPDSLDAAGLARATVESVAENTSDAVVGPLAWGAGCGVAGLLGYRAVNTLDAMVGHRSPRYARFGTASARLDDLVNLLPARLTGLLTLLLAAVVGGDARAGWAAWRRDAGRHPSPNAGVCEATAAGVLGLRLGGETIYSGRSEQRPVLGSGRPPGPVDIARAVRLSQAVEYGALVLTALSACAAGGRSGAGGHR